MAAIRASIGNAGAGSGQVVVLLEALPQLHQDQIRSDQRSRSACAQQPDKTFELRSADAREDIEPRRGVEDERDGCSSSLSRLAAAARRWAFRAACKRSLTRRERNELCYCSRTITLIQAPASRACCGQRSPAQPAPSDSVDDEAGALARGSGEGG